MYIIKGNGEKEEFQPKKLHHSLVRAGATGVLASHIVSEIERDMEEGMTTNDIYTKAFDLLKEENTQPVASRYSLRRAVMALGPSGFPFERLLGEIFAKKGYDTQTGVEVMGRCVMHEVDVVAKKENELIFAEAKFHNKVGFKTDVKVTLYVHSRAEDLNATNCDGMVADKKKASFWLITNTKFTKNAKDYGDCVGLRLVGWNYSNTGADLQKLIEDTGLHPLSCLTTLTDTSKNELFKMGLVLCRDVKKNVSSLEKVGLSQQEIHRVLDELEVLCQSRHS